jgi:hypothetical protein
VNANHMNTAEMSQILHWHMHKPCLCLLLGLLLLGGLLLGTLGGLALDVLVVHSHGLVDLGTKGSIILNPDHVVS